MGDVGVVCLQPHLLRAPQQHGPRFPALRPAHRDLGLRPQVALGLDATFFTDKTLDNRLRPTELDFTPAIIVRPGDFEVHLAYEIDMPLDQDTLKQQFIYLLGVWAFDP
jgi:hypothetical protein